MDGSENLTVWDSKCKIEGNKKTSDEENDSRSFSKESNEKTSKIEKSCFEWMSEDILEWHDRNPEHKKSDESDHIPGEFVYNNQKTENCDNRSEDKSVIGTKNSRPNARHNRPHCGSCVSSKNKNPKKKKHPTNNCVAKLIIPSGSYLLILFCHEKIS